MKRLITGNKFTARWIMLLSFVIFVQILHKFLTSKPRNVTKLLNGTLANNTELRGLSIPEIVRSIQRYNAAQVINNEDIFCPVQNDTIIIVIQVGYLVRYLSI